VDKQFYADIARRAHAFPLPPIGFEPLSATNPQLEKHGLLARPDEEAEPDFFLLWKTMLSSPLQVIQPEFPKRAGLFKRVFDLHRHAPFGHRRRLTRTGGVAPPVTRGYRHREDSRNWSGAYITPVRPNRFVHVTGGWTVPEPAVPTVLPNAATGNDEFRSSTWIGLDGHRVYPHSSLPQIGTSQFIRRANGADTIQTGAWWQWWKKGDPNSAPVEIVNFPVSVGDKILASLKVQASGDVHFHLKNQTSGLFTTFVVIAPGTIVPLGSTAEWIMERPTELHSTHVYPLPRCSDVIFNHCMAKSSVSIGAATTMQKLDNPRLIRMYEIFESPHRIAFVSQAQKNGRSSVRIFYREAGT